MPHFEELEAVVKKNIEDTNHLFDTLKEHSDPLVRSFVNLEAMDSYQERMDIFYKQVSGMVERSKARRLRKFKG